MSNATVPTPDSIFRHSRRAKNRRTCRGRTRSPPFLADSGGRWGALDIGCGRVRIFLFLAKQGWDVTSLDFMPRALEYTQARAREAGVSVTPVEADVTQWQPPCTYDLVLDHGLLHNMDPARHAAYRERVMAALADDGDFLLLHWHPRFPGQPDGRMGPRRVGRGEIQAFFAPELSESFYAREEFEDLPDLVGGSMVQAYYWFRRNPYRAPGELIADPGDSGPPRRRAVRVPRQPTTPPSSRPCPPGWSSASSSRDASA